MASDGKGREDAADQGDLFQRGNQFPTLVDQRGDLFAPDGFAFEFAQHEPFGDDVDRVGVFDALHGGYDLGPGKGESDADAGHAPRFRESLQYYQVREFRQAGQEAFVVGEVDVGFVQHDDAAEVADRLFDLDRVEQIA